MSEKIAVVVLKKLKLKTRKKFNLFLKSPYYNKNQTIVEMVVDIDKFILANKLEINFEDYYYNKLKRTLSKKTFVKYLSIINTLLKKFAACEQLSTNQIDQEFLLLKYLESEKFDDLYVNQLKNLENLIEKNGVSFDNYLHSFQLKRAKTKNVTFRSELRFVSEDLQNKTNALDRLYVAHNMFSVLYRINQYKIKSKDKNLALFEEQYLDLKKLYNKPDVIIDILSGLIELELIAPSKLKAAFEKTVLNLRENAHKIDKETALNFYILLSNNASSVYKQQEYYKFLFTLYKEQVDNKVAFYKDKIIAPIYKNIAEIAIKNKELVWLDNFLETYKNKIAPKSIGTEMYNYCQTKLKFTQEKYTEVCKSIKTLKFKDIFYKISVKRLELLANFELQDWLLLESLINAFRVAIVETRSDEMGIKHIEYNRNFIKYFYQMFKMHSDVNEPSNQAVLAFEKNLKSAASFPEKDWISLKLKEIKKSKQI